MLITAQMCTNTYKRNFTFIIIARERKFNIGLKAVNMSFSVLYMAQTELA
jgi:hypothetical protein